MNKKGLVLGAALTGIIGASMYTLKPAYAYEKGFGSAFGQTLAQDFAKRFNLNKDEVSEFFEAHRKAQNEERQIQRRQLMEDRLNEAVSENLLTEEQKQALLEKIEENKTNAEMHQALSSEERETLRNEHRAEMEDWAKENGIDLSALQELRGEGQLREGHFHKGWNREN